MLGLKVLNDPDDEQSYHYFVRPTNNTYEILSVLEEAKYANTPFDHYPLSFSEGSSRGNFIIANQGDSTGTLIHQLTKK